MAKKYKTLGFNAMAQMRSIAISSGTISEVRQEDMSRGGEMSLHCERKFDPTAETDDLDSR